MLSCLIFISYPSYSGINEINNSLGIKPVYYYNEIRANFDYGISFGIDHFNGDSYPVIENGKKREKIMKDTVERYTASNGKAVNIQYVFGYGFYSNYKNKPAIGLGFVANSSIIKCEETDIYNLGAGIDFIAGYILHFQIGTNYSQFSQKMPVIKSIIIDKTTGKEVEVYEKKYLNGPGIFFSMGIDIPITSDFDIFFCFNNDNYSIIMNPYIGEWTRNSLRLGISYKF